MSCSSRRQGCGILTVPSISAHFPEPCIRPLEGEHSPALVMLGLNPGAATPRLQGIDGYLHRAGPRTSYAEWAACSGTEQTSGEWLTSTATRGGRTHDREAARRAERSLDRSGRLRGRGARGPAGPAPAAGRSVESRGRRVLVSAWNVWRARFAVQLRDRRGAAAVPQHSKVPNAVGQSDLRLVERVSRDESPHLASGDAPCPGTKPRASPRGRTT